jgi:membrane dipeptidase
MKAALVGKRATLTVTLSVGVLLTALSSQAAPSPDARIDKILDTSPLIDGHNDLPWEIRKKFGGDVSAAQLEQNHQKPDGSMDLMTDIPRLKAGRVGAQFWSVWIPVSVQGAAAVQMTLEQIDIVKRMTEAYPANFELALTAADIRRIHRNHKIASLIGVEGGHQINESAAVLRQYYDLGVRYMTLTHTSNVPWADSATDTPKVHGLTPDGERMVREMNRLGMLVDLSHVSEETMLAALKVTQAPVMFSHSSARAINAHPRNVSDDVLKKLAQNNGVVMVNFFTNYVSETRRVWAAERDAEMARLNHPPYGGIYIGQPEKAKAALEAWDKAHPKPEVTIEIVADHIDHIRQVAGIDHVGLGSDFDGIDETPKGLEAVDRYPALLKLLAARGYSDQDLAKVAGGNLLRVLTDAERVADGLKHATQLTQKLAVNEE